MQGGSEIALQDGLLARWRGGNHGLGIGNCVFRIIVTDRFGIVTAEFGNVTERFGDVTDGVLKAA